MRYKCRSCQRVFHLEAGEAAPCPYCGGVLGKEQGLFDEGAGEGSGAGSGAGPGETFFASSEDLDIGGWPPVKPGEQDQERPGSTGAPAAPARNGPALRGIYEQGGGAGGPPGLHVGVPSPTSMITPDAGPSASPDSYLTQPGPWSAAPEKGDEADAPPGSGWGGEPTQTDTSQLDRMARTAPNLFRGAPPAARTTSRPPAMRAPSGGRTAAVAIVAVVLGLAAGAGAMLLWLRYLPSRGEAERIAKAERKAAELDKALKVLTGQRGELLAEKQALVAQIEEIRTQQKARPQAPPTYPKALGLTLESLKLLERRVDLDRALETAEAAVEAEPTLASAHRVKGRVLAALGRAGPALAAFEAANEAAKQAGKEVGKEAGTPGTESGAGDAEALLLAGEVCLTHLADRERAAGYYAGAAEIGAGSAFGLVAKARADQIAGDLKAAVTVAQTAAKADPTLALAPLVTGEIALDLALGRTGSLRERTLERAGQLLAEAVRLDPNSARACLMRGRMLVEASSLKKAERGFGLARYERQDEAARLLRRAKELSPDLAGAYVALAELRLDRGALRDPAAAVKLARDAVDLTERKDVDALVTLAAAQAATGDPRAAANAVEEALKLAPMNGELRPVLEKYKSEAQAIER